MGYGIFNSGNLPTPPSRAKAPKSSKWPQIGMVVLMMGVGVVGASGNLLKRGHSAASESPQDAGGRIKPMPVPGLISPPSKPVVQLVSSKLGGNLPSRPPTVDGDAEKQISLLFSRAEAVNARAKKSAYDMAKRGADPSHALQPGAQQHIARSAIRAEYQSALSNADFAIAYKGLDDMAMKDYEHLFTDSKLSVAAVMEAAQQGDSAARPKHHTLSSHPGTKGRGSRRRQRRRGGSTRAPYMAPVPIPSDVVPIDQM